MILHRISLIAESWFNCIWVAATWEWNHRLILCDIWFLVVMSFTHNKISLLTIWSVCDATEVSIRLQINFTGKSDQQSEIVMRKKRTIITMSGKVPFREYQYDAEPIRAYCHRFCFVFFFLCHMRWWMAQFIFCVPGCVAFTHTNCQSPSHSTFHRSGFSK